MTIEHLVKQSNLIKFVIKKKGICYILFFLVSLLLVSGCISKPNITPTATATPFIINVTSYPSNVKGGTNFAIQWEVSGRTGNIIHTAVHWGFKKGGPHTTDYGGFSKVYTGKIPQKFSVNLTAPDSGIIYFRAHAIIDGTDVYTSEYSIIITP